MITYEFVAKCEQCGHESGETGPLNNRYYADQVYDQFIATLRKLGWRIIRKEDVSILLCPACAQNAS